MRGRFTPGANDDEWCERRLLARIHGYTVKRLRAEIEPVAARDFLRFLLAWQRVAPDARMQGPDAVEVVVAQLEGFEAPAGAWESEILPARIGEYEPSWLDDQCLAGRISWARLRPRDPKTGGGDRGATPVRTTPIALLARRNAPLWSSLSPGIDAVEPSNHAQTVAGFIREHGASFFDELVEGTGLLRTQTEDALAELVALGLVNSDSFGGLRALADALGPAPALRRRQAAPAHRDLRHGRRRPLGAHPPPRRRPARRAGEARGRGACGPRPAAALWRGVLAPHRARSRLAAALARSAAGLSPPRSPRRDPRRPLRRRLLR